MENANKPETQELTAQELAEISGGTFAADQGGTPGGSPYPAPGVDNPLGDVNVHDLVDEKLHSYPPKYGYPEPYSAQSEH
jgi:bacteriocin-like protein